MLVLPYYMANKDEYITITELCNLKSYNNYVEKLQKSVGGTVIIFFLFSFIVFLFL